MAGWKKNESAPDVGLIAICPQKRLPVNQCVEAAESRWNMSCDTIRKSVWLGAVTLTLRTTQSTMEKSFYREYEAAVIKTV